jgi:hypothetical protein
MAYGDGGDAFNLESFIFFPILLFLYNRFPFILYNFVPNIKLTINKKKKKKKKKTLGIRILIKI